MHSNAAILVLALSAIAPVLSAPLPAPASSNEARAVSLGALGKELAKGLASGGALAGLVAGFEKLDGSSSTPAQKRGLDLGSLAQEIEGALSGVIAKFGGSAQKRELEARAVGLGALAKELAKGLASGGALAGLVAGFEKLDGSSSTPAQKRGLDLDSLAQEIEGALSGVLAKFGGAAQKRGLDLDSLAQEIEGALSGVLAKFGGAAQKRELEDRAVGLGALAKELAKGLASGGALAGLVAGFEKLDGSDSTPAQRRSLLSKLLPAAEDGVEDILKKAVAGGIGSAVGGSAIEKIFGGDSNNSKRELTDEQLLALMFAGGDDGAQKREIDARGLLSKLLPAAEDGIDDILKKAVAGGVGSAVGGSVIGSIFGGDNNNSKREPLSLGPIGKLLLGTGTSIGVSSILGDLIDKVDGQSSKREVDARGLLSKLLPAAEDGIDDILKKAVAGGVGSAVGGSVIGSIFGGDNNNSKRELTDEQLLALMLAGGDNDSVQKREPLSLGPIGKLLLGTGTSIGVSSILGDLIDKVDGQSSKRSLNDLD
ncbi:hypothetical protein BD410DRAFT_834228 [Rickenella mellea]|uniref:Uncharacterized protein n=1 Tax=Rickenella mellea TaxID=50990 RepID=A0A4V3AZQ2_9AGAM|nr:hypothetical protein BD410DRAFT_834228 [Rickenella mellea]